MNTADHNSNTDLDWLAFCYVADELDSEQRAQFEDRMANDATVREAVVQAVRLTELVDLASAENLPKHTVSRPIGTPGKHLLLAPQLVFAASILLTLFAIGWVWQSNQPAGAMVEMSELAVVWAEVESAGSADAEDASSFDGSDETWAEDESPFANSNLADLANSEMDYDEDESSDWMLVALNDMTELKEN